MYASKVTNALQLFDDKLPLNIKAKLQITEDSLRMATPYFQGRFLNKFIKENFKCNIFCDCTANIGGNFCSVVSDLKFDEYHCFEIGAKTFKVLENNVKAIFGEQKNIYLHNEDSVPYIGKDKNTLYLIDPPWGFDYKKDIVIKDLVLGDSSVNKLMRISGSLIFKLPSNFDVNFEGATLSLEDNKGRPIYKYFCPGLSNSKSKTVVTKRFDFWHAEQSIPK